MINQWGRKHFIALTQPFPSYQQSSLSLLLKSQRTLELRSLDPGSSQTEAGKLAGLSTSHLSPESPLNGLNLCIPAQSHLLIRPQETAWFPNGSMACSWQQNKGRGEQRSKVKAQRRHYPKKTPKKQKKAPSEVWGRGSMVLEASSWTFPTVRNQPARTVLFLRLTSQHHSVMSSLNRSIPSSLLGRQAEGQLTSWP